MEIKQFNKLFRVPEIVVFQHVNFQGLEFRTNVLKVNNVGALTQIIYPVGVVNSQLAYASWNMDENISSIIVVSGKWQFYKDPHCKNPVGGILEPGYYPWVGGIDIPNDSISSFECVEQTKM